jgi:uncharacterized protein (TIGR00369 family)
MSDRVYDSDPRQPIVKHMGMRFVHVDTGESIIEIDIREDLKNSGGMLQGGVIATLVDVAGGIAASRAVARAPVVTADMTIHYLAPGRTGPVRAVGEVLRAGRRSVVAQVKVYDTGEDDRLMATGTMTMTVLNG